MGDLVNEESVAQTCPLWLRILRIVAVAAAILACSQPIVRPTNAQIDSDTPLVILLDGSWAGAPNWEQSVDFANELLDEAQRMGRLTSVISLTDESADVSTFQPAGQQKSVLLNLSPMPWKPDGDRNTTVMQSELNMDFDTYWISDGLKFDGQEKLSEFLGGRGEVFVIGGNQPVYGILPVKFLFETVRVPVVRSIADDAAEIVVEAVGNELSGREVTLARTIAAFSADSIEAVAEFRVPLEIAYRIQYFRIQEISSAGAVSLVAGGATLNRVALFAGRDSSASGRLLSQLHFLRSALKDTAELIETDLIDAIATDPGMIILADVANLSEEENASLVSYVSEGGLLVHFAGPRLASSDFGRQEEVLFPVRLRGSRTVGGSMSWRTARGIKPFASDSPFFGLTIPDDVEVTAQLLAQPSPDLSQYVLAELDDGTPLVTSKQVEDGRVVMFHVTANAEWSTLPLSGLMPAMLNRLSVSERLPQGVFPDRSEELMWKPVRILDAGGTLNSIEGVAAIEGEVVTQQPADSRHPPGFYASGELSAAVGALSSVEEIQPAVFPPNFQRIDAFRAAGMRLDGILIALAILLFAVDAIASVWLSGRLFKAAAIASLVAVVLSTPESIGAQDPDRIALQAVRQTSLAYVMTGSANIDSGITAGLKGLGEQLKLRTTVVLGEPLGIDPSSDELGYFPLIYWPVGKTDFSLSRAAVRNLNSYLRNGGMIIVDTADAGYGGLLSGGSEGQMSQLVNRLDIPSLQPVPQNHVLTRSFYIISEFPGRYEGDVWVEAGVHSGLAMPETGDRVNDGVTPIVVGGNDWVSAWAQTDNGISLFSTGFGWEGDNRREMAVRFGVNLVMHALTGHYKSDQLQLEALSKKTE